MKISFLQENFKQSTLVVSHIASKNTNLPILTNLLIDVQNEIKLIATNLDIAITCLVRGKIEEKGSFTVDAKKISDYISLLPNQKINLSVEDNALKIESENYKTKIIGESSEDYPVIPQLTKGFRAEIDIIEFKKALSQVVFASANSDSRPELSGVLFLFSEKELVLAATDSFRLAEKKVKSAVLDCENLEDNKKAIIPVKTIQELIRIIALSGDDNLNKNGNKINISLSDNQILFSFANIELISRLIEGQYPDYKQIIPTKSQTTIALNKEDFVRAIKTSAIFSHTTVNDINLEVSDNKNGLIISASSGQIGENIVEIEAEIKGDKNKVSINYRYILDVMQAFQENDLEIELVNNSAPCILRAKNQKDYLYIIMPIRQ